MRADKMVNTRTATITIRLWAAPAVDLDALLVEIESALDEYSDGGRDLDWTVEREA